MIGYKIKINDSTEYRKVKDKFNSKYGLDAKIEALSEPFVLLDSQIHSVYINKTTKKMAILSIQETNPNIYFEGSSFKELSAEEYYKNKEEKTLL